MNEKSQGRATWLVPACGEINFRKTLGSFHSFYKVLFDDRQSFHLPTTKDSCPLRSKGNSRRQRFKSREKYPHEICIFGFMGFYGVNLFERKGIVLGLELGFFTCANAAEKSISKARAQLGIDKRLKTCAELIFKSTFSLHTPPFYETAQESQNPAARL